MPRSGANKQDLTVRAAAAACYLEAGSDEKAAAALFLQRHGSSPVARLGPWCRDWALRFLATGTVADAPRSGRPPLVAPVDAQRAAQLFKKGRGRREDGFTSIEEAVRERPGLAELLHEGTDKVSIEACALVRTATPAAGSPLPRRCPASQPPS